MVPEIQPATRAPHRLRFRDWPVAIKLAVVLVAMSLVPLIGLTVRDVRVAHARLTAGQTALLAARADQIVDNGFADDRTGRIGVELARVEGARIRLRVTNDGIPLPAAFSLTEATSMGLQLVCTLARQLEGTITVTTGTETSFEVLFEENHHAS